MRDTTARIQEATLVDLLDRVIDQGVILTGDVTISVADVDLIYLGLRLLLVPAERLPGLTANGGRNTGHNDGRNTGHNDGHNDGRNTGHNGGRNTGHNGGRNGGPAGEVACA